MLGNSPEKVLKNVGRRIAEIRMKKGLTQMRLAEKAGISTRWLQQVESGYEIPVSKLAKVANALDCGIQEFFKKATSSQLGPGRPPKKKIFKKYTKR